MAVQRVEPADVYPQTSLFSLCISSPAWSRKARAALVCSRCSRGEEKQELRPCEIPGDARFGLGCVRDCSRYGASAKPVWAPAFYDISSSQGKNLRDVPTSHPWRASQRSILFPSAFSSPPWKAKGTNPLFSRRYVKYWCTL